MNRLSFRHSVSLAACALLANASLTEIGRAQRVLPTWTVAPAPEVTIDESRGEAGIFSRIVGLARLSGDRIAVVSRGTQDIRVFSATGDFIRKFGGTGDGPGEYRSPSYLGRRADTLFLYDYAHRRLTAQDVATGSATSIQLPQLGNASVDPYARTATGQLLAVAGFTTSMRRPDGLLRYRIEVLLVDPSRGFRVDTLGQFPWLTSLALNPDGKERAMAVGTYPFGPHLNLAAVGDRFVLADGATRVVQFYPPRSRTPVEVVVPIEDRPFDRATIARVGERAVAAMRSERDRMTVGMRHDPRYLPQQRPFIRGVLAGPDDELWVEEFREDALAPAAFVVIDRQHRAIARVVMPPRVRALAPERQRLLAVMTDEDDVERVVVLKYRRQ